MPDPNSPVFPNPPQPYFGQGVRNMPQPIDPYDKAEKSTLGTTPIPAPLPPIEETKPPVQVVNLKEEVAVVPPPLTQPTPPLPPTPPPSVPTPPTPPPPSPTPTPAPIPVPMPVPTIQPISEPPPPAPPNVPYKDYPLDYKFPKKRRLSPWLLVIPVVLILLGLITYGVIYFLNRPEPQPAPDDNAPLILKDDSSQNIVSSPSALPNLPSKPQIPAENGFGTLPPPSFESFALNGLSLGGVVVANESTASAIPEKSNVYAFSGDQNLASSAAIFSPEHQAISKSITQLTQVQFDSQVAGLSLYAVINPAQALSNLVSSTTLYGVVDKKVDWTKNKLKSLVVANYYLAHYYPPKSKYWYPIYVFEGNGKLVGEAVNSSGFKMIFFLPAIPN